VWLKYMYLVMIWRRWCIVLNDPDVLFGRCSFVSVVVALLNITNSVQHYEIHLSSCSGSLGTLIFVRRTNECRTVAICYFILEGPKFGSLMDLIRVGRYEERPQSLPGSFCIVNRTVNALSLK
jgi:hypothetical protein